MAEPMTQEDAMRDTSTNAGYTTTHTASTPVVCQPAAPVAAVEAIEACYVQWRSETDGEPQWSRLTTLIGATVARLLADATAAGARAEALKHVALREAVLTTLMSHIKLYPSCQCVLCRWALTQPDVLTTINALATR